MKKRNLIKTFIASLFVIILVFFAARVYAETLNISGNASNSNNSVQLNQTNSTNINQSNSANVNNNVNVNSNTGGNSINGGVGNGSITTGDINTNVNINNQLNTNIADVNCKNCPTPTPTKKPSQPSPTTPPAGPTNLPGDGGGKPGDGGGNGGVGGASAPSVLGLAQASGENELLNLLKLLPAAGFFAVGSFLLRKNA